MKKLRNKCVASVLSLSLILSTAIPVQAFGASDTNGHWAQSTINKWINSGYINGYPDGTFRPEKPISRAEFVVLVNQAFQVSGSQSIFFSDVKSNDWAYSAIQKGVARGYIKGDANGTFRPGAMVTRQEAAVMISQIKNLGESTAAASSYTDAASIPSWAKGYVGAVTQNKIMSGFPDGSFKPNGSMTRAEAVTALDKALTTTVYNNSQGSYTPKTTTTNKPPASTTTQPQTTKTTNAGDVTLSKNDTSLSNKTIKGDLILSKELGTSSVNLDNVEVEGDVIVYGGKKITAEDCTFKKVILDKEDCELINDGSSIDDVVLREDARVSGKGYKDITISDNGVSSAIIDAEADYVFLDTDASLKLYSKADISKFEASKNCNGTTITFSSGASVDDMELHDNVRINGRGDIETMTVYASGVRTSIEPDTVRTKDGASKPRYVANTANGSGTSGNSHYNDYDDLTVDDDGTESGGKYDNVTVEANNAKLKNMTIYGDLTISSRVKNGTVTLTDLDIRGSVYVYGGGDHSIDIYGCDIDGDIIVDKTINEEAVAIELDDDTGIDGSIRVQSDAILRGYNSDVVIDSVEIESTGVDLEIRTDVRNLSIERKAKVLITDGAEITDLKIQSGGGSSEITLSGTDTKIKTLDARATAELKGTGTVETINAYETVHVGSDIKNDNYTKPDGSLVKVTGVTLSSSAETVVAGGTVKLTATVTPSTATNKTVTWKSSDTSVAKVNGGTVTGVKAGGTATITVTTADGNKTATCKVTVISAGQSVAVTGVKLSANTMQVGVGQTKQLTAAVLPANATNRGVRYASSAPAIATVDQLGKVTGVKVGTAQITATTSDGNKTDTCAVEVTADPVVGPDNPGGDTTIVVNSIQISSASGRTVLNKDEAEEKTLQLTAAVDPSNAKVSWKSDSTGVATVDDSGLVTAVAAGSAQITATAGTNKKAATFDITVIGNVTNIVVDPTTMELNTGNQQVIVASVSPGYSNNLDAYKVVWESDKEAVATTEKAETAIAKGNSAATANSENKVLAKAPGTAIITAKISNPKTGALIKAVTCKVTVSDAPIPVDKVTIKPISTQKVGDKGTFEAVIEPKDIPKVEIAWTVNNPSILKVDKATGEYEALAQGVAVVTVTANTEGSNQKRQAEINVAINDDRTITVEKITTGDILPGDTLEYKVITENLSFEDITKELYMQWSGSKDPTVTDSMKFIASGSSTTEATLQFTLRKTVSGTYNFKVCTDTAYGTVRSGTSDTDFVPVPIKTKIESVEITKSSISLAIGGSSVQLSATVKPAGLTDEEKKIEWESEDPTIAKVDSEGKVSPVAKGTTKIIARSVAEPNIFGECTVTVADNRRIGLDPLNGTKIQSGLSVPTTLNFRVKLYYIDEDVSDLSTITINLNWVDGKTPGMLKVVPVKSDDAKATDEFKLGMTFTDPLPGTYKFSFDLFGVTSDQITLTVAERKAMLNTLNPMKTSGNGLLPDGRVILPEKEATSKEEKIPQTNPKDSSEESKVLPKEEKKTEQNKKDILEDSKDWKEEEPSYNKKDWYDDDPVQDSKDWYEGKKDWYQENSYYDDYYFRSFMDQANG